MCSQLNTGNAQQAGREVMMQELRELLGKEWVKSNRDYLEMYQKVNSNGLSPGKPEVVVFPATVSEIKKIVEITGKHRIPLFSMSVLAEQDNSNFSNRGGVLMDLRRMDIVGG